MELQYLKYFSAVAETLNFSEAAKRCRVSQPSLSSQIRILEERLGVQLLHRNKRSVLLTKAGKELIPKVRKILLELDELSGAAKELKHPLSGNLFVGVTPMIAQGNVLDRFAELKKESPALRLSFTEDSGVALIQALLASQLDLILTPYHAELETSRIEYLVTEHIDVAVFSPKGKKASDTLPFIRVNSVCGLREFMAESLKLLGREGVGSLQAAHLQMIQKWIELGLGWSILPEASVEPARRHLFSIERPRNLVPIRLCAAMLRGQRSGQILPRFAGGPGLKVSGSKPA